MPRYKANKGKGVTLRNMSGRVSDDGSRVSIQVIDTPFELTLADVSDLYEVLGDVLYWANDEADIKN